MKCLYFLLESFTSLKPVLNVIHCTRNEVFLCGDLCSAGVIGVQYGTYKCLTLLDLI